MIYLDVTSAATSRMSTGVQRAIRGIYQVLGAQSVVPVIWDRRGQCYARLSELEEERLSRPFARACGGKVAITEPLKFVPHRLGLDGKSGQV
jgi:hypothetical protein